MICCVLQENTLLSAEQSSQCRPSSFFASLKTSIPVLLVKLLCSRLSARVQMIGFVSEEKTESCFTRRSAAKHLTPAKERKQSGLVFVKSVLLSSSEACFLCVPFSLPPAAVLPLNYSPETTHLSLFSLSMANGLSIYPALCPTVKTINSIKLSFSAAAGRRLQADGSDSLLLAEKQHWVNQGKLAPINPGVVSYVDQSVIFSLCVCTTVELQQLINQNQQTFPSIAWFKHLTRNRVTNSLLSHSQNMNVFLFLKVLCYRKLNVNKLRTIKKSI